MNVMRQQKHLSAAKKYIFSSIAVFSQPAVLQLQEVGDFEAQNCLPALNLIRSTKLHLTTEPPISCRCYYSQLYSFAIKKSLYHFVIKICLVQCNTHYKSYPRFIIVYPYLSVGIQKIIVSYS